MKATIKKLLLAIAPTLGTQLLCIRARRKIERSYRKLGIEALSREVAKKTGLCVQSGPFAGLLMSEEFLDLHLGPKLLGTYELEIHNSIEEIIVQGNHNKVINVGCAEGYYAVGLALRCSGASVLAFDPDPMARARTQVLARLNNVEVEVRGALRPGELQRLVSGKTLIIMDCEGAEVELLDPKAPEYSCCDLIVELHPKRAPHFEEVVRREFGRTHEVEIVQARERQPHPGLPAGATNELRDGSQGWAIMRPRAGATC